MSSRFEIVKPSGIRAISIAVVAERLPLSEPRHAHELLESSASTTAAVERRCA
jgi:hypothetical protein